MDHGRGADAQGVALAAPYRHAVVGRCALAGLQLGGTEEVGDLARHVEGDRLLRQYLATGADLRTFSQADLDAIAHELNHRPRNSHGYRTPAEVYAGLLNSGDALPA